MRSMDVSRSLDSLASHSRFLYHVPPARVFVCFPFRFTYFYEYGLTTRLRLLVCFPFLPLSRQLVYAYLYCLHLSFCSLSTRLSTRYFWNLRFPLTHSSTYGSSISFVYLYLYLADYYIYGLEMGLLPIFNLLCNHPKSVTCEIPRTLLVLSSSLAKATASRFLGVISSVYSLTGSEVQPTQCTSVRS